jgi:hypothetical protein
VKSQMHFQSNYLIFWLNFFCRVVDLRKKFKNIYIYYFILFIYFSFGQNMKKIIIVKVGYFCKGQRMMWDNVVNLSHILYQQVQLCKLYN